MSSNLAIATGVNGGNAAVTVDGSGTSLTAGQLILSQAGSSGGLTFSNGSTGLFHAMFVDSAAAGSNATLNIQSGAKVTGTILLFANIAAPTTGVITIGGTGSALTLTGAATASIGATSLSTGTLNLQTGGAFTSGTGL